MKSKKKITLAQQKDLDTILYFMPSSCRNIKVTDEDIKMFFENSERGLHGDRIKMSHFNNDGFNALISGKVWRGRFMQIYEDGVLEGSMPYFTILGGLENNKKWWQFWKSAHKPIPRSVIDFMKKEIFKGLDSEIIENCYQSLITNQ